VIEAAGMAHARRILAEVVWVGTGAQPDSPWLREARDALRDYLAAIRLILEYSRRGGGSDGSV
jgi:hypothetical protein